jgi:hypothetical protein
MTTPATEVTQEAPVSPESRLEEIFSRGDKKPETEAKPEPETQETESEDAAEEEAASDGEAETKAEDTPEDDGEEVEFDGELYKLPKKLKEAVLRQKDYTQKTQEVAEIRKRVEMREQYLEQAEKIQTVAFEKAAEMKALDNQIAQYLQVDWNALADQNPTEFLKLDRQYRQLVEVRGQKLGEIQTIAQERQTLESQTRERQIAEGQKELKRRLPKLDASMLGKIKETASGTYGFTATELGNIYDPRVVHVLHDAAKWRELQAGKPAIAKKVTEAKPIQATSRNASNNQATAAIDQAKSRLAKTGKTSDAEAYLERLFSRKK